MAAGRTTLLPARDRLPAAGNRRRRRISRQHLTQDWKFRAESPAKRRSQGPRNRRQCQGRRGVEVHKDIQQRDPEVLRCGKKKKKVLQDASGNQP